MVVMMMSSTFNCHMTPIGLQNLNYEMVISVISLFMALWNIFYLMPVAPKLPLFTWPNTSRIRKSI